MEQKILDLFAVLLQVSPDAVDDGTRPADLERWDSMQHLILVSGFEEEFDLDLDPEDLVEMYESFGEFKRVIIRVAGAA
jgi:acyl carrier protein